MLLFGCISNFEPIGQNTTSSSSNNTKPASIENFYLAISKGEFEEFGTHPEFLINTLNKSVELNSTVIVWRLDKPDGSTIIENGSVQTIGAVHCGLVYAHLLNKTIATNCSSAPTSYEVSEPDFDFQTTFLDEDGAYNVSALLPGTSFVVEPLSFVFNGSYSSNIFTESMDGFNASAPLAGGSTSLETYFGVPMETQYGPQNQTIRVIIANESETFFGLPACPDPLASSGFGVLVYNSNKSWYFITNLSSDQAPLLEFTWPSGNKSIDIAAVTNSDSENVAMDFLNAYLKKYPSSNPEQNCNWSAPLFRYNQLSA